MVYGPTSWLSVIGGPFVAAPGKSTELEFSSLVTIAEPIEQNNKEKNVNSNNIDFITSRRCHEPSAQ